MAICTAVNQKKPKWRVSRKQGCRGRISLKIGMDTQFGKRTYPHSVAIYTITLSAQTGGRLFSRHVKKRPRSARAVKISEVILLFLHHVPCVI